ncbi:unnamed protein product [Lupinus luteus]|uniref:Pentatricopeptide repeat-containing protein n=1 Tax=Lupinus luteus TaxID=3873 RepID=A0AAV1Y093_LUPLU
MGLTYNGKVSMTMDIFEELIREGIPHDRITLAAVLLACNYRRFVDEAIQIFSSMEKDFGVKPGEEHHVYVVELLSRAVHEDPRVIEIVAEKIMEREPRTPLPYLVLARAYEMMG